jgi:hypothetical protein
MPKEGKEFKEFRSSGASDPGRPVIFYLPKECFS